MLSHAARLLIAWGDLIAGAHHPLSRPDEPPLTVGVLHARRSGS